MRWGDKARELLPLLSNDPLSTDALTPPPLPPAQLRVDPLEEHGSGGAVTVAGLGQDAMSERARDFLILLGERARFVHVR